MSFICFDYIYLLLGNDSFWDDCLILITALLNQLY